MVMESALSRRDIASTVFSLGIQKAMTRFFSITCLMAFLAGCGGGIQRSDIKGNVTFDGQPVVFGEIVFIPEQGPSGTASIVDGEYDTAVDGGQGIVAGPHRVLITGYENELLSTGDELADAGEELNQPPLFLNYEITTDLSPGTKDFQVPAEAASTVEAATEASPSTNEP